MSSHSLLSLRRSDSSRIFSSSQVNPQSSQVLHQLRVKIFCGLHSPAGIYRVYHLFFLLLIVVNCFVINLVIDFDLSKPKQQELVLVMAFIDIILVVIFILELALRLFAVNCIEDYHGLFGIFKYFREYKLARLFDIFCIAILLSFLCMQHKVASNVKTHTDLRILHLFLMFQVYRTYLKVFLNFANVVRENIRLIVMSISLYILALILISYIVYFLEFTSNSEINSIFDSTWFSFVSLATIGYGDVTIKSQLTRVLTALFIMCGYCIFSLPASIVGSAMAMKLQEKRQKILCLHPAANLLQKTWRYYAIHRITNYWSKFALKQNEQSNSRTFNNKEKYVLYFICKVSFLLAQNRFKYANLVYTTGSVPMQYVDLQRKIELINALVRKNKGKIELLNSELRKIYQSLLERKRKLKQFKSSLLEKQNLN